MRVLGTAVWAISGAIAFTAGIVLIAFFAGGEVEDRTAAIAAGAAVIALVGFGTGLRLARRVH
jgi:hypothetical protein